jgi:ABC-type phosphate transport system substrate-binding protein
MRASRILALVAVVAVWLCGSTRSIAADDRYELIVNAENSVTEVDKDFVRDAFLKKSTSWGSGEALRPIDAPSKLAARDRFTQDVIRKTPAQLKNYWNQQIFSGKGVPPPEADSVAQILGYVLANPGAIGYVPVGTDVRGAKVIRIR